eukprot:11165972-Lingulodinium_polyedra.AAC.1
MNKLRENAETYGQYLHSARGGPVGAPGARRRQRGDGTPAFQPLEPENARAAPPERNPAEGPPHTGEGRGNIGGRANG